MFAPSLVDAAGRSRLLPGSVPFRYFGAGVLFHAAAWAVALAGADRLAGFRAGLGAPLAALHLATLGFLAMVAMGASLQLLPIATVQPIRSVRAARLAWWLFVPGVVVLTAGMGEAATGLMFAGALACAAALAVFAWLFARNLAGAKRLRTLAAFGWAGWGGLVVTVATGLALAGHYAYGFFADARAVTLTHLGFALAGFMGLLALGFASLLVPMFAVSRPPPESTQRRLLVGWLGTGALFLAAQLAGPVEATGVSAVAGFALAVVHVVEMERALARRLRKTVEPFLVEARLAWGGMILTFASGAALAFGAPGVTPAVFVAIAVLGWLATFVLAILQRILPFLASVHAKEPGKAPPLVSALTPRLPQRVHLVSHGAGVVLLVVGLAIDSTLVVRAGALLGLVGALAFVAFYVGVVSRARLFAFARTSES